MAKDDIRQYQFPKGQSGNPNGRPKNRVSKDWLPKLVTRKRAREMSALTKEETEAWESVVQVMTQDELGALAKSPAIPMYAKNLAMAILFDTKNGKTTTIDKLRERRFGKVVQKMELTGADGEPLLSVAMQDIDLSGLTKEEREEKEILGQALLRNKGK